jgi:hypothetical protein
MAGESQYVSLPDGSYVEIPANATPDQLSSLRTKLATLAKPAAQPKSVSVGNPITPKDGEDFAATMGRAVVAGKQESQADLDAASAQAMKDAPKMVGETLGAAALGGPAMMAGEMSAPIMGRGAMVGAGLHAGNQALHGHLPSLSGLGESAIAGALMEPLLEFGGGSILGKIAGRYLPHGAPTATKEAVEKAPEMIDRIIKTPEEFRDADRIMALAKQRASERGTIYASGGRP